MTYPASLTLITVSATFLHEGSPEKGKVVFYNGVRLTNATTDETLSPVREVAVLDATGSISIQIPASDDPDWSPAQYTWRVTEQLRYGGTRTYNILLPYNGGSVNLADLAPVAQSPGVQVSGSGVTSVNGDSGPVVTLDATDVGAASSGHDHSGSYSAVGHTHAAADVNSGTLDIARVPTGTTGTTAALGNHNHTGTYADATHAHSAADVTSGTLAVGRGGTGLASYTIGHYVKATGATTLAGAAPATVLSDIGAAASSHTHVQPNPAPVTLTDAATIATDASLGNLFRVTLGGNRTLGAPTNPTDGQKAVWEFIQDGTGSRTITLDAAFALGTDISSVTLSTTAGKRDFMGAIYSSAAAKWFVVAFAKGY